VGEERSSNVPTVHTHILNPPLSPTPSFLPHTQSHRRIKQYAVSWARFLSGVLLCILHTYPIWCLPSPSAITSTMLRPRGMANDGERKY